MAIPKVLIVPDVPNWIWHTKALSLKRHLAAEFDIDILFYPDYRESMSKNYSATLVFPWYGSYSRPQELLSALCSYGYERIADYEKRLRQYKRVACVSRKLFESFSARGLPNLSLLMNGVEEETFRPEALGHEGFKVLMVGKKAARNDVPFFDYVKRALTEHMIEVEWIQKDYRDAIPFDQMPSVYNRVDVYAHIAKHEGTPNTLFEAASCGLPCVSNDVGCAPELLPSEFITDSREQFVEKILDLYRNRQKAKEVGQRNRETILSDWTWKKRSRDYVEFFRG